MLKTVYQLLTSVEFCTNLIANIGIPEKWDPKPGTQDPGPQGGTQDLGPHKWDPGPQYDQVRPETP